MNSHLSQTTLTLTSNRTAYAISDAVQHVIFFKRELKYQTNSEFEIVSTAVFSCEKC